MRMRRKKNAPRRLMAVGDLLCTKPAAPLTDPASVFGRAAAPVFLEIGAGKGGFACEMARQNPDAVYFALERVSDCVLLAAERADASRSERGDNLRFLIAPAEELSEWFAPGTVDRLFLNFSDPWPKSGCAKRRLTHRRYLALYMTLLKPGGTLTFKTDNAALFDFSLEEIAAAGLTPDVTTRDLHASPYNEGNVQTEYEQHFAALGTPICMLRVTRPADYVPQEMPDAFGKARRAQEIEKKKQQNTEKL